MAAAVNCLETEAIWNRVLSVQSASGSVPVSRLRLRSGPRRPAGAARRRGSCRVPSRVKRSRALGEKIESAKPFATNGPGRAFTRRLLPGRTRPFLWRLPRRSLTGRPAVRRTSQAAASPTATPMTVSASRRMGCCQASCGLTSATISTTVVVMAAVIASSGRPISEATRPLRPVRTARPQRWNGRKAR